MRNLFFIFVLIATLALPTTSPAKDKEDHPWKVSVKDYKHAKDALYWSKRKRWREARLHASKAEDKLIYKIFLWMQYTSGSKRTTFKEISKFIQRNHSWPQQDKLWKHSEHALSVKTPPEDIINWFRKNSGVFSGISFKEPVTAKGKQLLAEAQLALKGKIKADEKETIRLLRESWVESNFGVKEERDFLKKHKKFLREEDYIKRIDRLLWDKRVTSSRRILKKVSKDHQKLFKARIGLIMGHRGIDNLVRAVPKAFQSDQGLLFDRIRWRAKRRGTKATLELLPYIPPNPMYPKRWWKYKMRGIRHHLNKKQYERAYRLAIFHGLDFGMEFSEAEWFSGWIALRFLGDPKSAYRHFYALYHGVRMPISLARGAYWAGRAAEANDNEDIAEGWYQLAIKHPSTFYGQLATAALGHRSLTIPKQPSPSMLDMHYYHKNELVKAAYILHNLGYSQTAKRFLTAAAVHAKTEGEALLISKLGQQIERPDYGVHVAKQLKIGNTLLLNPHYPILPKATNPRTKKEVTAPETPLIHAITLQESAFKTKAKSSKGARGLMQLMPGTAKSMARKLRLRYSRSKLTKDPNYNVVLGSHYLDTLIKEYKGSYIVAMAAYNGGPRNVNKWIKRHGDPRKMKNTEDVIDWIEKIPFKETRNYVQRILENLQMYRYVLSDPMTRPKLTIEEDLKR